VTSAAPADLAVRLRSVFLEPEAPLAAFEVRKGSAGLVRLGREGRGRVLRAAASLELPEGSLALSVSEPNVKAPEAFRATLASLAERAGLREGGRVGLVLPDPVARVSLVPSAELRARRRTDAEEMIRFRLRRSVPFDIRDSRVARLDLPSAPGREAQALVGAIARSVLDSYEAPLRELGACAAQARGDELLVNWDHGYLSLFLTRDGQPLLLRTLSGDPADQPSEVAREIASTVLYHRERLAGEPLSGARLRSGARPLAEARAVVAEALGVVPEAVAGWALEGWDGDPAMSQALAGAAAAVLGSAA
jgi:type IV pilus assembly protein PilM